MTGITVQLIQALADRLCENRLPADASSDRDFLQIQKDGQIGDVHGDLPAESLQDIQRRGVSRVHFVKKLPAVHERIRAEPSHAAVEIHKPCRTAYHAGCRSRIVPVRIAKTQEAVLSRCEVHAVQDLSVDNKASAYPRTDNIHACIAAPLEGAAFQFRERGAFSVVGNVHRASGPLRQGFRDFLSLVVLQGAAAQADAVHTVDEARKTHSDPLHLIFVRGVERIQRFDEVLLIRHGRRHAPAISSDECLIHNAVFDLCSAYVKYHQFHSGPPYACSFMTAYYNSAVLTYPHSQSDPGAQTQAYPEGTCRYCKRLSAALRG